MEELKNNLLKVCNDSGLPLEAIMFVTKDLYRDVQDAMRAVAAQKQVEESEEEVEE